MNTESTQTRSFKAGHYTFTYRDSGPRVRAGGGVVMSDNGSVAEVDRLRQLLHHWVWLWNEGELEYQPFQTTQAGFDAFIVKCRVALRGEPES